MEESREIRPITQLLAELGITEADTFGPHKAKVNLSIFDRLKNSQIGHYVVVAGITPTPQGEGKSTACIGLSQALASVGKRVVTCMRQPSMGPTFGIKGGAAGGGRSQIVPMEEFNLHLTGDVHAISIANNLLCAQLDTRRFHEETCSTELLFEKLFPRGEGGLRKISKILESRILKLGLDPHNIDEFTLEQRALISRLNIDPNSIMINRVVDVNDRLLRGITIGEGGKCARATQVDIAVSSEIMAVMALAEDLGDLKARLARMVVVFDAAGSCVTVDDLGLTGALTVLLKDALNPTLMQTMEGTPVFVHCGPFANIAHGNSSVIADQMALKLVGPNGYVVTECGFGSDMGLEKLVNIKCRQSGLAPSCVVLVATCRALKHHGFGTAHELGAHAPLLTGLCNLEAHIGIAKNFNLPVVVCVNRHVGDSPDELEIVVRGALKAGADFAGIGDHFARGGEGATELAEMIVQACALPRSPLRFTYPSSHCLRDKITAVCTQIYGASAVDFSADSEKDIARFEKSGFSHFPICMAKTQYSLSHDPNLLGRPTGFTVPILRCRASVGAGFIYLLAGPIMTMPGLPIRPAFYDIDIDPKTGKIEGMF